MSAIFGFCCFGSYPPHLLKSRVTALQKKLEPWAPDGFEIKTWKNAAFGHARLNVKEEDHSPLEAVTVSSSGLLITASARLDNRDELVDQLSKSNFEKQIISDSQLVLKAVEKWGEDAVNHLYGDWAYAAFDPASQKLFMARDRMGNTGLYYFYKPPIFAFAPSPHALLALDEAPKELNEWKLACNLVQFYHEESADETHWKGISSLLPHHQLNATGEVLYVDKYWQLENLPAVNLNSDEEYFEQFRGLMRDAVKTRLRSKRPIGSSLSAGLDSGTVTAMAADILKGDHKELTAFTSIPLHDASSLHPGVLSDEWEIAHSVNDTYSNIHHVGIYGKENPPHFALKKIVDLFGDTVNSSTNAFWILSMLEEAKNRDMGVLLTGQLGNGGISWGGGKNRVLYKLLYANFSEIAKTVRQFKAEYGVSLFKTLRYFFLNPVLPPMKQAALRMYDSSRTPWRSPSIIRPKFAERLNLKEVYLAAPQNGFSGSVMSPGSERRFMIEANSTLVCSSWHRWGAHFNLDVRDPSADIRLLEFCLGIPDEIHAHGWETRRLIRKAMKGLVPDPILQNKKRGQQASDVALRVIEHKESLLAELRELAKNDLVREYLDMELVTESCKALDGEQTSTSLKLTTTNLLMALQYGYFLERHF